MNFIGYAFMVLPYAVAIGAAFSISYLVWLFYRRYEAGLLAVAAVFTLDVIYRFLLGIRLGVIVYPQDLVFVLLAFAGLLRLASGAYPAEGRGLWLLFGAILLISFAEGVVRYGTGAGVEYRAYFYLWSGVLYTITFPMPVERVHRALKVFVALGATVFFIVIYRWAVENIPITPLLPLYGSWSDVPFRVIPSMQALLLAQIFLLAAFFHRTLPWLTALRWSVVLWLLAVVVLQHRSVWLATLVGIGLAFLLRQSARGGNPAQVLALVFVGAVTLVGLSQTRIFDDVRTHVGTSAYRAVTLADTAGERLSSWKQLIVKVIDGGPKAIAIGLPFGSDTTRYSDEGLGAKKIGYQAHNMYVQIFMRSGLLGLGLFIASVVWLGRRLYALSHDPIHALTARAFLVLLAAQLTYYIAYGADYLQAMLYGLMAAYALAHKPQLQATTTPAQAYAVRSV